jgi:hypothetical protein
MERIFLAYANSQQSPLPTLEEEDRQVHKTLARREASGHFKLHRESFAAITSIVEYLTLYQSELVLFSYSGHAGQGELLLGDEAANAAGIAQLLGRCPKLKLVLLNGCSTQGQVQALLGAGVPAVIATSAPVGDRAAAQFAITFFQALSDSRRAIGDAFEDGIAAAQVQSRQAIHRGALVLDEEAGEGPRPALWGLYCREQGDLAWKLPEAPPEAPPAAGAKIFHQQAEKIYNIENIDKADFS